MEHLHDKMRIIQEIVPGKQVTLAHIIANPDKSLYEKLGLNPGEDFSGCAIGILNLSPAETAIIAGDIAIKSLRCTARLCGPGKRNPYCNRHGISGAVGNERRL